MHKRTYARTLTFSGFEGRWQITGLEGEQRGKCLVEHELAMKPLVPVPPPISYYTKSVLEKEVGYD